MRRFSFVFFACIVFFVLVSGNQADERVAELRNDLYKKIDFSKEKFYDEGGKIRDDVFSRWSNSQLKAFADVHGLDVPQTSTKDELEKFARKNKKLLQDDINYYAKKASEESKPFLSKAKEQFIQTSNKLRDDLYEQVDFSKQKFYDESGKIKDDVFNSWSNSQLKAFADLHGLDVPQTSKKSEVERFARRNKKLLQDDINHYTRKAAEDSKSYLNKANAQFSQASKDFFDSSVKLWSDSRLKQFLDARGVHVGPKTNKEKLVELVQQNKQKAIQSVPGSWTFDAWSTEDLQKWLKQQNKKADGQRQDLVNTAQDYLNRAKDSSTEQYNAVVQSLQDSVNGYKQSSFDKWSDSDLKAYLDTYGIKTYQGSTRNELIAHARSQYRLFTHGADPDGWNRIKDSFVAGGMQLFNGVKVHGGALYSSAKDRAEQWYQQLSKQSPLKFQS